MMRSINESMLEALKPSIREKIKSSLSEVFDMALLINDKDILEETIDQLSDKFSDKFASSDAVEDIDVKNTVVMPPIDTRIKKKAGHGVNLISGKSIQYRVPTPEKSFEKTEYRGVRHKTKNTWVIRCGSKDIPFPSAVEAAKAYDKIAFQKTGRTFGLNFPEDYQKSR